MATLRYQLTSNKADHDQIRDAARLVASSALGQRVLRSLSPCWLATSPTDVGPLLRFEVRATRFAKNLSKIFAQC
ncbi:MAG: hypothetical protein U0930_15255 [Pirellulales bacterium]